MLLGDKLLTKLGKGADFCGCMDALISGTYKPDLTFHRKDINKG